MLANLTMLEDFKRKGEDYWKRSASNGINFIVVDMGFSKFLRAIYHILPRAAVYKNFNIKL